MPDTPRYLDDPSAEDIVKFAREREEFYALQDEDDEKYAAAYNKQALLSLAGEPGDNIKAISSGVAGQAVDQTVALINVQPQLTLFPLGDTQQEKDKVDSLYEPFLNKLFARADRGEDVNGLLNQDLALFHRGWSVMTYDAAEWSSDTPEYKKLLSAYLKMVDDEESEEEKVAKGRKALEQYKRDHFPLIWYHVPARRTWPLFSRRVWLPEVVEIREMSEAAIEAEYPGTIDGDPSASVSHTVLVYANWRVMKTVMAGRSGFLGFGKSDSKVLHSFEHKMGCNPYSLRQMLHRVDDPHRPWRSVIDHNLDNMTAWDTALSDLLNHTRKFLRSGILLRTDASLEGEDPQLAGQMRKWDMEMDKSYVIPEGAVPMEMPMVRLSPELYSLMNILKERIDTASLQPQLQGESKSGESNVLFTNRFQVREKQYAGFIGAIVKDWTNLGKLAIRSMKALNDGAPSEAEWDKVSVIHEAKGILSVGYKEIAGYENTIQPRVDRTLDINLNVKYAMANAAKELGISMATILGSILNFEDPAHELEQAWLEKVDMVLDQYAIEKIAELAGLLVQEALADQTGNVGGNIRALSPAFEQVLGAGQLPGGGGNGGIGQAGSNLLRTGVPQAPSQNLASLSNPTLPNPAGGP